MLVVSVAAAWTLAAAPAFADHCGAIEAQRDNVWRSGNWSDVNRAQQEYRRLDNLLTDCRLSHASRGGGPSGGGYSGGGNRLQQGLGVLQGILGTMQEMNREREQRERAENNRLGRDAEREGVEHFNSARYEEALAAYERGYAYFERNGEVSNMDVMRRKIDRARAAIEAARRERQAREEAERWERRYETKQGERDQAVKDLYATPSPAGAGGRDNPFGCGKDPHPPGTVGCWSYQIGGAPAAPSAERTNGAEAKKQRKALMEKLSERSTRPNAPESSLVAEPDADAEDQAPPLVRPMAVARVNPFDVAQALRDRPAPGVHRNLTEDECRKWRGRWSTLLGECQIAPLGDEPGRPSRLLIVDEPGSVTEGPSTNTVKGFVADMEKKLAEEGVPARRNPF